MSVDLAREVYLLIAVLGLALPVSYAGLPVLGQGAFVAVGAFGTALLGPAGAGWPLGIAVLVSVALAAAAGFAVAVAASRLEGAELGLATWALAWLVAALLVAFPDLSGGAQGLVRAAPAHLVAPALGLDLVLTPAVHVVIGLVVCVALVGVLIRLERGPGGLDLAALREGPELAASLGVPVGRRRRTVLAVAAGLGGLAGAGVLTVTGVVAAADVSPLLSLQLLVAVLAVPLARWWAPLIGAALVGGGLAMAGRLADSAGADPARVRGVVTAVVLVVVLAARTRWRDARRTSRRRGQSERPAPTTPRPAVQSVARRGTTLQAANVSVNFGGVRALDDVDLTLAAGEVHALIGPNGSGKSTLLRVLAGALTPHRGEVRVDGTAVAARMTDRVASGVARTPQHTLLVPGLNVQTQVAIGARGGAPIAGAVIRHLAGTPFATAQSAARASPPHRRWTRRSSQPAPT